MKQHPFESTNFPVIGILGGGQLAQMLAQAAWPLGCSIRVLVRCQSDALPGLAGSSVVGDWNNPETAVEFAQLVDYVILENEFINPDSLASIEKAGIPLIPGTSTIRLIQDKWHQKQALARAGLPVVSSQDVYNKSDVVNFSKNNGWPIVVKRRHEGYDGKGNATVRSSDDLEDAWSRLSVNANGLYAEAFCPFERELAVMVCRSVRGEIAVYPVVDTVQRDHVCHVVRAPSTLPGSVAQTARDLAIGALEAVDGYGMFGVEMFLTTDGSVLVNELAPRVHNSGHYTIEACICSQFENHLRAVLGLPLGSTAMIKPHAVMVNLLGTGTGPALPSGYARALEVSGAHLHLYGKGASSLRRKMGHVTALGDTREEAETLAFRAGELLKFG